jgi:hypothetical protein
MEISKRTRVVLLAREKRTITNYYIIKPYLQQKFSNFQFWLLFSFYLFSVCLFFFVFFINLIKLLQFF